MGGVDSRGLDLTVLDRVPDGFLDCPASNIARILPGPTLIRLAGRKTDPLFLSVLLHGDEETGFDAVRDVLRRYRSRELPRAILLFVGNVRAAQQRVRMLADQLDYNRAWPGTLYPDAPEARLMRRVLEFATKSRPFASIDIHNTTGTNPHYACINRLEEPFLHLARLFARTIIYFEQPVGVQSAAFARYCPAATVECGKSGSQSSIAHAATYIEACLALDHMPAHALVEEDFDLLQTFAVLKVPPEASFSFDGAPADFRFRQDLDHLNFGELAAGTCFGLLAADTRHRLDVQPGGNVASVDEYLDYADGKIRLARSVVPAMLTVNPRAVRLDCLGYLMHRIDRSGRGR